jgi:hypothetical protein
MGPHTYIRMWDITYYEIYFESKQSISVGVVMDSKLTIQTLWTCDEKERPLFFQQL